MTDYLEFRNLQFFAPQQLIFGNDKLIGIYNFYTFLRKKRKICKKRKILEFSIFFICCENFTQNAKNHEYLVKPLQLQNIN